MNKVYVNSVDSLVADRDAIAGIGASQSGSNPMTNSLFDVIFVNKLAEYSDVEYYSDNPDNFFRHCSNQDVFEDVNISFAKSDAVLNIPLFEEGATKRDYNRQTDETLIAWDASADVQGTSVGVQDIYFNADMSKADTMGFDANQASQIITAVPAAPWSVKEIADGVTYIWNSDSQLFIGGVEESYTPPTGNLVMEDDIQAKPSIAVVERTSYKVYQDIITG